MSERLPLADDARAGFADDEALPQVAPVGVIEAARQQPSEIGAGQSAGPVRARSRGKHYRSKRHRPLRSLLVLVVLAAALALLLRLFVLQTFWVPTGSMEPTLRPYDRLLVVKLGYTVGRGTIVVFRQPPADTADTSHDDLVKRVIGLPGQTIWSVGNAVYIDGRPIAEPWLPKGTQLGMAIRRQTIPKGDYFVMGDNRTDSDDSRDWGPLPGNLIIGKVILVFWRDSRPAFHLQ